MAIFSLKLKMAIFLQCFLFFLLSYTTIALYYCAHCEHKGKASYFSEDSALSTGSCAYGSTALYFNNGYLAAAASSLYGDGAFCGGCYRMRCKNKKICKSEGTTVIVTDELTNNKTDFVLSRKAYMAMAKKGMEKQLLKNIGALDVIYKRYPCEVFDNKNLTLRVEESSKWPNHLVVKVLYQGGQTEIRYIHLTAKGGASAAFYLQRNHSAVWEIHNNDIPKGPLVFYFEVLQGKGTENSLVIAENLLPAHWKPGMIYDTGVQIREFTSEGCGSVHQCPDPDW